MTKRVETRPRIVQEGLEPVLMFNYTPNESLVIELCDLPRVIKKLQDIREATNIDCQPDITGICSVCGNEVLDWEAEEL